MSEGGRISGPPIVPMGVRGRPFRTADLRGVPFLTLNLGRDATSMGIYIAITSPSGGIYTSPTTLMAERWERPATSRLEVVQIGIQGLQTVEGILRGLHDAPKD